MKTFRIYQEEHARSGPTWALVGERKAAEALNAVKAQYPDMDVTKNLRGTAKFNVTSKLKDHGVFVVICREATR